MDYFLLFTNNKVFNQRKLSASLTQRLIQNPILKGKESLHLTATATAPNVNRNTYNTHFCESPLLSPLIIWSSQPDGISSIQALTPAAPTGIKGKCLRICPHYLTYGSIKNITWSVLCLVSSEWLCWALEKLIFTLCVFKADKYAMYMARVFSHHMNNIAKSHFMT